MLQNPNAETISNYLTSGGVTTLSGALNPDEPLSFDHWMSSLGVAITVYGGYKMASSAKGAVRVQPKPSVASSADDVLAKPPGAAGSVADDVLENGVITVSNERLKHSTLGEFNNNGRLINGEHGQTNIEYLREKNVEFNIVKQYNNGVRIGNVPSHKNKFKRSGVGQSCFPEKWSDADIKKAGEYVANLPENIGVEDGNWVFGEFDGVRVGIIKNGGEIGTIIPDNSRQPDM